MNIFPRQFEVKVTKDDVARLLPSISNLTVARRWVATNPDIADLKRALLIEVYKCCEDERELPSVKLQRGVYRSLLAAISEREKQAIDSAVSKMVVKASRKLTALQP